MPEEHIGVNWTTISTADKETKTISSGDITPVTQFIIVAAQSGTTDDLDGIVTSSIPTPGDADGAVIYLMADAGDTITIRHNIHAAATKNILIDTAFTGITLTGNTVIRLVYNIALDTNGAWVTTSVLDSAGRFNIPIAGANAGLLLGTDVLLYRGAADALYLPERLRILNASASRYRADWSVSSAGLLMNVVDDTGGVYLPMIIDLTTLTVRRGSDSTHLFTITDSTGRVTIPITGVNAGLLLGGDALLYRSGADVLRTPDALIVDGLLTASGDIKTDKIDETSSAVGVTIENVTIKDGSIELHEGIDTIATDEITAPTGGYIIAAAQTGTTDDLDGIGGGADGRIIIVRADAGDVITVKHSNAGAGTGRKLLMNDNADLVLTGNDEDSITFLYDETLDSANGAWFETSRGESGGGAGHGTGSISGHGDVDAMTEARGDLFHVGTGGSNWTRLAIGSAGAVLGSDGTDPSWTVPKRTITLTAAGGKPSTTSGCAAVVTVEAATNDVDYDVLAFDKDTDESAFWPMFAMPNNWDGGTVTARFYWTAPSGSGTFTLGIKGRSYADDDAIDQAYGTEIERTDTLLAVGDVQISPESDAITLNGGPAGGELVSFKVTRKTTDTLSGDAHLIAIKIIYTLNSVTDA